MSASVAAELPAEASAVDIARAFLAAFGERDIDAALTLLTEDVVWHVDGAPEVPTVGLLEGRDRVKQWILDFPNWFEPREFDISVACGSTDEALMWGRFHYVVRATGRPVEGDFAMRFSVRGGRISRYQIVEDSLGLARAFNAKTEHVGPRVRVNELVYGYDDTGDGPMVLFLHDLFADRSAFHAQTLALQGQYRCVALDMPGHGVSCWRSDGWTLDDTADDLALMIKEMRWGPVALVGHSHGGITAARLTARHPELVRQLVLISTSARAEPVEQHDMWRERRRVLGEGSDADRVALVEQLQEQATDPQSRTARSAVLAAEQEVMANQDAFAMQLALDAAVLQRTDARDLLPGIRVPTLVLAGETDTVTPAETSAEIAELIPDARLVTLDGVAHHAPSEAPQQVAETLAEFLAANAE